LAEVNLELQRMGVYELLKSTPAIKALIRSQASSAEVLKVAMEGGMTTLEQDAIDKILQGHTDLKQVLMACR